MVLCFSLCMSTLVSTCVGFNLHLLTSVALVQLHLLVPVSGTVMCGSSLTSLLCNMVRLPHPLLNKRPVRKGG